MKKFVLALMLVLVGTGCVSGKCARTDKRALATTSELSFEDLAKASNVVVQTFDKTSNICGISDDKLISLPQQWKSVMDGRFEAEKTRYTKKSESEREAFGPSDCEATCSCGVYANFYEYLEQSGVVLTSRAQDQWAQTAKAAAGLNLNDSRCVQDAEWFCRSRFIQAIIKN